MSGTPQVPQIPSVPTMASTESAAGGVANTSDIGSLMAPIVAAANQPVPDQYSMGKDIAAAHTQPVVPAKQYDSNQKPITMQVADIKHARRQNAVAGLANTIGQARQAIQEKKQASLKDRLVDVMKYKTNAENATTVLNDPNATPNAKAMAQKVFDVNKKQLNTLLSDPKHVKEMSKALDISFVDPEKNKTPEVQAYQQAMKEFKDAGPFKSDNPAEHAVAQAASGASGGTASTASKPANTAPQPQHSQTPYADAALAKDSPAIVENPNYDAVLKQKQAANEQLTKMVPHLIDAESKAQIQAAKDNNAAGREVFKAASDFRTKAMEGILKLEGIEQQDKTRLQATAMRDSAEIASATIRANAAVKVAETNGLSREQVQHIKQVGADDVDKRINATETALKTYGAREADIKNSSMPEDQKKKSLAALSYSYQQDTNKLKALQDIRAKQFPDIPAPSDNVSENPKPEGTLGKIYDMLTSHVSMGVSPGEKNADSKPATSSQPADNKPGINLLGDDLSDESGDDPDENSDSY